MPLSLLQSSCLSAGFPNVSAWHHLCHPQQPVEAHSSSGEVNWSLLIGWWWSPSKWIGELVLAFRKIIKLSSVLITNPHPHHSDHPDHLILQGNVHRAKLWRDLASAWEGEGGQGSHQDGIRLHSWGHAGFLSFVKMIISSHNYILEAMQVSYHLSRWSFQLSLSKSQLHSWGDAGWFSSPKSFGEDEVGDVLDVWMWWQWLHRCNI